MNQEKRRKRKEEILIRDKIRKVKNQNRIWKESEL